MDPLSLDLDPLSYLCFVYFIYDMLFLIFLYSILRLIIVSIVTPNVIPGILCQLIKSNDDHYYFELQTFSEICQYFFCGILRKDVYLYLKYKRHTYMSPTSIKSPKTLSYVYVFEKRGMGKKGEVRFLCRDEALHFFLLHSSFPTLTYIRCSADAFFLYIPSVFFCLFKETLYFCFWQRWVGLKRNEKLHVLISF